MNIVSKRYESWRQSNDRATYINRDVKRCKKKYSTSYQSLRNDSIASRLSIRVGVTGWYDAKATDTMGWRTYIPCCRCCYNVAFTYQIMAFVDIIFPFNEYFDHYLLCLLAD